MYLKHFSLKDKPFSLTPDTQLFLNVKTHQAALNTILLALKHSEGFIKIVGEVGTGKTMLCRVLLWSLRSDDIVTAYIPNPCLSPEELKYVIAQEIGAKCSKNMPAYELTSAINERLLALAAQKKQVILVVDETQTMPRETIEALRLLTNLETEKRKLLQVVIFGQPELDKMLNRKDLRQLKQRIVFSEYLRPLGFKSMRAYIEHRLAGCGASEQSLFSQLALLAIFIASSGTPRLVNILCHKAMMITYGRGEDKVTLSRVVQAIADTSEARRFSRFFLLRWQFSWVFSIGCSVVLACSSSTQLPIA